MTDRRPTTLQALLLAAARVDDAGLRLLDARERETWLPWSKVVERARRVAGGLLHLGIQHGEQVALIFPTSTDFFDAFFGVVLAGGVPVPLYPPARLGRLDEYHRGTASLVRAAGARLILAGRRVQHLLGETVAAAGPTLGCRRLEQLPAPTVGAAVEFAVPTAEEVALVQFSSGTTVDPKPVALSHRAVLAQTRRLNAFWPAGWTNGKPPTGVSWLPLYHDMGLIGCVMAALELPSTLTVIPPEVFVARPAVWLRALSRSKAQVSPAPNFAYSLCVQKIRDEELDGSSGTPPVDLSHWRVALNGAEPVSASVQRAFQERFARWGLRPEALTPVYGLAEAALAVTFSALSEPFGSRRFDRLALCQGEAVPVPPAPEHDDRHTDSVELVSVGRPLPDFQLQLRDEAGTSLPDCRVGQLWVRGPSLMSGYLGQPKRTRQALRDGWLNTGDLGFQLSGELYLTGRAKDLVILRGRNYAPQDFEQAVDDLPGLRRGCCVAVSWLPSEAESEALALLVEQARTATPEQLQALPQACKRAVLSVVGVQVDDVVVLPPGTLPRTSSGKLRRAEALRRWLEGTLDPPSPVTSLRLAAAFGRSLFGYLKARATPKGEAVRDPDTDDAAG